MERLERTLPENVVCTARMAAMATLPPSMIIELLPSTALTMPEGTVGMGWISSFVIPVSRANFWTRSSGTWSAIFPIARSTDSS